jgi:hypothetical protein
MTFTTTWSPVVIGGGGLTTHLSISNDGQTILLNGDVNGAWLFDNVSRSWGSLQLPLLGSPLFVGTLNPGLYHNSQGPTDVRVAPGNSSIIYYFLKVANLSALSPYTVTYLMRSTDRGATFTACAGYENPPYTDTQGNQVMGGNAAAKFKWPKIGIDPDNPDVIYVPYPGAGNKPKMSVDGGANFTEISGLPAQVANTIGAASWAIDPSSSIVSGRHQRIICYMDQDGIYETTDGGSNWTEVFDLPTQVLNDGGAFGPDGVYYIALQNDGVYKYEGGSFTKVLATVTNMHVAVHPTIAGQIAVLIPGSSIKYSTNKGSSFTTHATSGFTYTSIARWQQLSQSGIKFGSGNCRQIMWNPAVTDELWVCSAQGVCVGTVNASSVSTWDVPVLGVEELVGNEVVSIEGNAFINVFNWDEGGFKKGTSDLELADPPDNKTGPPAIAGWTGNLFNIWQASVDPQDSNLLVVCGNKRNPITMAGNGYSLNGGSTFFDYTNLPGPTVSTGQYQMVCVNNGVVLWIDGNNSGNSIYPMRTDDLGATAWSQLTVSNFPGHPGGAFSGFSNGSQIQMRLMTADAVDPNIFYIYNIRTSDQATCAGIWRSTDAGQNFTHLTAGTGTPGSGTPLSNPWYNNSLIFCKMLKSVPGYAGHLIMSPIGTSGPTFPAANWTFVRSTNGGSSWDVIDPNILQVDAFGFGKARTTNGYPTIFFAGYYNGVYGVYRITDGDASTITQYVSTQYGNWPLGLAVNANCVEGDKNIYGRCYIAFPTAGFAYSGYEVQPPTLQSTSWAPGVNPAATTSLRHRNFPVPAGYPQAKSRLATPYGHRPTQRLGSTFTSGHPGAHRIGAGTRSPPPRRRK